MSNLDQVEDSNILPNVFLQLNLWVSSSILFLFRIDTSICFTWDKEDLNNSQMLWETFSHKAECL